MKLLQPQSAAAVERELRARLTPNEYRVLQARLTGAVKAITTLRDRAPDLVPLMFGDSIEQARTLAPATQSALAVLIDELLIAAGAAPDGAIDRRRLMRIVSRIHSSVGQRSHKP